MRGSAEVACRKVSGRDDVIQEGIETIRQSEDRCIGMGRNVRWLRRFPFERAVQEAVERGVSLRWIAANRTKAQAFAEDFNPREVKTKYRDHGDVRVAVADENRALLAIPSSFDEEEDPSYEGIVVEDEAVCRALNRRFQKHWERAYDPNDPLPQVIAQRVRNNPDHYVGHLWSGLFSALVVLTARWALPL